MKLKYLPSIRVEREAGESTEDFINRVLKDPRLLPDQRLSLEQDLGRWSPFDELVKAVWIEQAPSTVPDSANEGSK
jgi:hypothetical protein